MIGAGHPQGWPVLWSANGRSRRRRRLQQPFTARDGGFPPSRLGIGRFGRI